MGYCGGGTDGQDQPADDRPGDEEPQFVVSPIRAVLVVVDLARRIVDRDYQPGDEGENGGDARVHVESLYYERRKGQTVLRSLRNSRRLSMKRVPHVAVTVWADLELAF